LRLRGIEAHNLKNLDLELPLAALTVVTGVSGSGKSSLVMNALVPALKKGEVALRGVRSYSAVVVDQSPIGTTPASNPATYTGVMDPIRQFYARLPQSRTKGFGPGRFSFNVRGGRCDVCEGKGQLKVEMHFLADVWVTCETCRGKRYNAETLAVDHRGRNIAQVLAMEVSEALEFFGDLPRIARPLKLLADVGLGYLRLGQSANTLSGGEAQRIKLVAQLAKAPRQHNIYLLDEPTTGLHVDDVAKLIAVLQKLVERGDTVVVIEHNMDVIQCADRVIELGPEAGDAGGEIVVAGTPEEVASHPTSHTARFLRPHLRKQPAPKSRRTKQEAS
jgi:excinuclease ABC subunit A